MKTGEKENSSDSSSFVEMYDASVVSISEPRLIYRLSPGTRTKSLSNYNSSKRFIVADSNGSVQVLEIAADGDAKRVGGHDTGCRITCLCST